MTDKKEKKKRVSRVPENETAEKRFQRVAQHRVQQVKKGLILLTKMTKSPTYKITEESANKIKEYLEKPYQNLIDSLTQKVEEDSKDMGSVF